MKRILCFLSVLLFLPFQSVAEWFFPGSQPSDAFLVNDDQTGIIITFLGDCTLGGEEITRNSSRGFVKTIEKNGFLWPFDGIRATLSESNLVVVNLEGVLSDNELTKVKKKYNFLGSASYAKLLKDNGIDLVNLANNHTMDYGKKGLSDTKDALQNADVSWISADKPILWTCNGFSVGFTASGSLNAEKKEALSEQIRLLREQGALFVVHTMHCGNEYQEKPSSSQRNTAKAAVEAGADLVIGHHPHIVQGLEFIDGVPILYSLGNAVFGGNLNPRDYDALMVQTVLALDESGGIGFTLRLIPISVSSSSRRNDFRPVPLTGKDAARVLQKMEQSTGITIPSFLEEEGWSEITVK